MNVAAQSKENKETLRNTVKRYIQKEISDGTFKPGDRIVETRLAKELQISQAPVREAVLELTLMGRLEERPYSGSFVRKFDLDDVEDIFNIRAFLEEYAAKRAAKKRNDKQLEQMKQIIDKMDQITDKDAFVDLDNQFHELILDASGSKSLKRTWRSLQFEEWTYESALITSQTLEQLKDSHEALYECIKEQADHTAGAMMFLHIKQFSDETLAFLRERGSLEE